MYKSQKCSNRDLVEATVLPYLFTIDVAIQPKIANMFSLCVFEANPTQQNVSGVYGWIEKSLTFVTNEPTCSQEEDAHKNNLGIWEIKNECGLVPKKPGP